MEKAALIHLEPSGIRMITEKVMGGMYHKQTDDMFEPISFIDDIFEHGDISEDTKANAMRIFKLFRTITDNRGIKRVHIIACSLFSTSMKMVKLMFDEMNKLSPFSVHLMTPEEECKQSYNAMVGTTEYPKGIFFKVNLHNSFVVNFAKRNLVYYKILPFGAYTLNKKFVEPNKGQKPKKIVSEIAKFVKGEVKGLGLDLSMFDEVHYVGTGSFFHVLGRLIRKMSHYPLDVDNNYVFTIEQLEKALELMEEQGFDETKRLANLSHENLSIILTAFAMIKGFAQSQKAPDFIVASRDVINSYMASRVVRETSNDSISNDQMDITVENIRYFYDVDESNSEQVHFLTMELFRQMSIVHKLSRRDMRPLKIASTFYDFGKRVSMQNHSKYVRDAVMYAGVLNATHRDLVLAGFAAQCQNLENFSLADWVKFKEIVSEEDLIAARKIGVMIALAKALDSTKQKKITQLSCDLLGDIVIIKATSTEDISYELAEANKLQGVFKKVFKKSFQIM